jgi:outer membrane protein assembly factor BamB
MRLPVRPGFTNLRLIKPPASDGNALYVVETDGNVAKLDVDGNSQWRNAAVGASHPLTAQISIGVLGGRVVVNERDTLFALSLHDGSEQWRAAFPAHPYQSHFDGLRLWETRRDRAASGDAWEISTLEIDTGVVRPIARRSRRCVVVGTTQEEVVILERSANGSFQIVAMDRGSKELWTVPVERPSNVRQGKAAVPSQRLMGYGHLLIHPLTEYGLLAIDIDRGCVAWELPLEAHSTRSVLVGDRLHVNASWRFLDVDAATGTVHSDVQITDADERRATASAFDLAHHDGVLYAASIAGTVFGWSLAQRALLWTHNVGARVESSAPPRIFLNTLWILDAEGRVHPFDLGKE